MTPSSPAPDNDIWRCEKTQRVCVYRISLFSDSVAIILHPQHPNEDISICRLPLHRLSLSNLSILLLRYPSIGSPLFHTLGSAMPSVFPPSHIHRDECKAVKCDALIDMSVKTIWRARAFQPPTWPHFLYLFISPLSLFPSLQSMECFGFQKHHYNYARLSSGSRFSVSTETVDTETFAQAEFDIFYGNKTVLWFVGEVSSATPKFIARFLSTGKLFSSWLWIHQNTLTMDASSSIPIHTMPQCYGINGGMCRI